MNDFEFGVAEEHQHNKDRARRDRNLKLTKDRKNPYGNHNYAVTDGLKPIQKNNRNGRVIMVGNRKVDLSRVRNITDLPEDDE